MFRLEKAVGKGNALNPNLAEGLGRKGGCNWYWWHLEGESLFRVTYVFGVWSGELVVVICTAVWSGG